MSIITIKNKEVLTLPTLLRVALKSIYDKKHLTFTEEKQMHESVVKWKNHLDLRLDLNHGKMFEEGTVDSERQIALEIIGSLLHQDASGKLDKRKEMFKSHGINYKKFHRLPEVYDIKDFEKGKEILKEHMRTNPEDYE